MRHDRAGLEDEGGLRAVHVHAVREDRPLVQRARIGQPVHHAAAEAGLGVPLIHQILGHVNVHAAPELPGDRHAVRQGLGGECEGGVGTHQAAGQRPLRPEEALVLPHAGAGALRAVAVRDLIAEHRADPHLRQRVRDQVEGSVDGAGRGVVIDQRGRAGEQRVHSAHERRGAHGLSIQRPVQPPPDALQDLQEVGR